MLERSVIADECADYIMVPRQIMLLVMPRKVLYNLLYYTLNGDFKAPGTYCNLNLGHK